MHELAMIQQVMQLVSSSAAAKNIREIHEIKLVVGKLTAALPDSLRFCFEMLTGEPPFLDTRLIIEETAIEGQCGSCGRHFRLESNIFFCCPSCNSPDVEIVAGEELYVDYYEGE